MTRLLLHSALTLAFVTTIALALAYTHLDERAR